MGRYEKIWDDCRNSKVPFLFVLIDFKKDKNLTHLAKYVGVSRQSIYGWRVGATPSSTHLIKSCEYLGLSYKEIITCKGFCEYVRNFESEDKVIQEKINQINQQICSNLGCS